jgi:hypothetical protein
MLAQAVRAILAAIKQNPDATTIGWSTLACNEIRHVLTA